jgi:asparagine synthase (glutamine-hydrolysing)
MTKMGGFLKPQASLHPVTFAAFREIPSSLVGTLLAARSQISFRTPYLDNELVALAYRAPLGYRRSPLPALRLIENVHAKLGRIPTDRGHIGTRRGPAWRFRRALAELTFKLDYLHKEGLPSALSGFEPLLNLLSATGVLGKHKFLAYRSWFRRELSSSVQDVLTDRATRELPFINPLFLEQMVRDHKDGRKNYVNEINAVLSLESINRVLLRSI